MEILIKGGIVLALLAILVSLGSGLVFLVHDRSRTRRTMNALTVRIGLSVVLFALILLGLFTGVLQPNPSPLS
ncbi:twin transmembrane helix small protein [Arhodomonas sp. AD133]|uniref:twin transmembrane helix small protein n=1 Tax=Arhodomonas sp. AD133 TaxID=3415009 RepID=UPI003EBF74EA